MVREQLGSEVNVPGNDLVQFTAALGAAILGQRRVEKLMETASAPEVGRLARDV